MGHAVVTIYDCQDHQASGVSVTYDNLGPQSVPYYFSNGLPAKEETKTDGYGLAGAVNVPVGTLEDLGQARLQPNPGRLDQRRHPPEQHLVRHYPGPIALGGASIHAGTD